MELTGCDYDTAMREYHYQKHPESYGETYEDSDW